MKTVSSCYKQVHKNGSFSSKNVISSREFLRLFETTQSEDDLSYDVPHITTFKTSALSTDAHALLHFKKTSNPGLERKIRNFVKKRYGEEFDPERVLLSAWNQYGCSEEGKVSYGFVYLCILVSGLA